jgi:hypothetical protein
MINHFYFSACHNVAFIIHEEENQDDQNQKYYGKGSGLKNSVNYDRKCLFLFKVSIV